MTDVIEFSRTVMFVGDYFTLMTTVVLDESLRLEDEGDQDFAVRVASIFMKDYYGFDVKAVSKQIGVIDENGDEIDEDE
jgi:hypothetical protein